MVWMHPATCLSNQHQVLLLVHHPQHVAYDSITLFVIHSIKTPQGLLPAATQGPIHAMALSKFAQLVNRLMLPMAG